MLKVKKSVLDLFSKRVFYIRLLNFYGNTLTRTYSIIIFLTHECVGTLNYLNTPRQLQVTWPPGHYGIDDAMNTKDVEYIAGGQKMGSWVKGLIA